MQLSGPFLKVAHACRLATPHLADMHAQRLVGMATGLAGALTESQDAGALMLQQQLAGLAARIMQAGPSSALAAFQQSLLQVCGTLHTVPKKYRIPHTSSIEQTTG